MVQWINRKKHFLYECPQRGILVLAGTAIHVAIIYQHLLLFEEVVNPF